VKNEIFYVNYQGGAAQMAADDRADEQEHELRERAREMREQSYRERLAENPKLRLRYERFLERRKARIAAREAAFEKERASWKISPEYPEVLTIHRTGEQYMFPDAEAAQRFLESRAKALGLTPQNSTLKQLPPSWADQGFYAYRRSEHEEWNDGFWPDYPTPGDWFADGEDFLQEEIEPRQPLITDQETGGVFLQKASNVGLFAFRGVGKSITRDCLLKLLIEGGVWTRFQCRGGYRVLLVDGELPKFQLQERLREFGTGGKGKLKILSPELMPNSKDFPALVDVEDQRRFLEQVASFSPDVIIFDTLKRCMRMDTNDQDHWLTVNDFLIELRSLGFCTVVLHHEGKNGTARGLTDGEDNLDVQVQLTHPYGHVPGEGLAFKWGWTKVRHGGNLPEFEARYLTVGGEPGDLKKGWVLTEDSRYSEVRKLWEQDKSTRAIATALDMSQSTVSRIVRKLEASKPGRIDTNIVRAPGK
jgi:AAA domain